MNSEQICVRLVPLRKIARWSAFRASWSDSDATGTQKGFLVNRRGASRSLPATDYRLPSVRVHRAVVDRLVDEDLAVADLQIEGAIGVCANPGFVFDWRALVPKVR